MIAAKDIMDTWGKLWAQYKNFSRLQKIYKSGDGAKKGLNDTQLSLMNKMQYFEPYVVDVTSDIHSSMKKSSSIWQKTNGNSSSTRSTAQKCNVKVPLPEKHYFVREEKKQKLFNIVDKLSSSIERMSEQTQELLQQHSTPQNEPIIQHSETGIRASYLKLIDPYFQHLNTEERASCLHEMLVAIQGL